MSSYKLSRKIIFLGFKILMAQLHNTVDEDIDINLLEIASFIFFDLLYADGNLNLKKKISL